VNPLRRTRRPSSVPVMAERVAVRTDDGAGT
jgi:hypothetical protein